MGETAFPVCYWPAEQPAPGARVFVLALGLAPALPRPLARAAVRQAVREALAAQLGVPAASLALDAPPGRAPQIAGRPIGISFSHEAGLSLVAVNLDGAVGVDLLREHTPPDWEAVARDYLGPQACARLRVRGGAGFALAWAGHEAVLKCHGLALGEWAPRDEQRRAQCHCEVLALPAGWAGCLALPREAQSAAARHSTGAARPVRAV